MATARPPAALDLLGHHLGLGQPIVGDHRRHPLTREALGHRASEPAGRSGDDRDLAVESVHARPVSDRDADGGQVLAEEVVDQRELGLALGRLEEAAAAVEVGDQLGPDLRVHRRR